MLGLLRKYSHWLSDRIKIMVGYHIWWWCSIPSESNPLLQSVLSRCKITLAPQRKTSTSLFRIVVYIPSDSVAIRKFLLWISQCIHTSNTITCCITFVSILILPVLTTRLCNVLWCHPKICWQMLESLWVTQYSEMEARERVPNIFDDTKMWLPYCVVFSYFYMVQFSLKVFPDNDKSHNFSRLDVFPSHTHTEQQLRCIALSVKSRLLIVFLINFFRKKP